MSKFPCTSCGICCMDIRAAKEGSALLAAQYENPEMELKEECDERGRCTHYDSEIGCKIYATRPLPCRIEDMAIALGVDVQAAFVSNAAWCNNEQEKRHLWEELRVVL